MTNTMRVQLADDSEQSLKEAGGFGLVCSWINGLLIPLGAGWDQFSVLEASDGTIECWRSFEQLVGWTCLWVMSRAGLEPATHWLKASCSTD